MGFIKNLFTRTENKNKVAEDSIYQSTVENPFFSVGAGIGSNVGTFTNGYQPDQNQLRGMYNGGSDIAATIVNIPVDESLMYWRKFTHPDQKVIDEIEKAESYYNVRDVLRKALIDERLFGGSVIMPILKSSTDGNDLITPIDFDSEVKEGDLLSLRHFDRWTVNKIVTNVYNPASEDFLSPDYMIMSYGGYPINLSRLIIFNGKYTPIYDYQQNAFWGKSILSDCYGLLLKIATIEESAVNASKKASYNVLKIQGLRNYAQSSQGMEAVYNKLRSINLFQNTSNCTLLDSEDDYLNFKVDLDNYVDLLMYYIKRVSGFCGIPVTKLLGDQAKGLNSSGNADNDQKNYTNTIINMRENIIRNKLNSIDNFMLRSIFGKEYTNIVKDLYWDFDIPKFSDNIEKNTMYDSELNRIIIAKTNGLITEEEAREELVNSDIFNTTTPKMNYTGYESGNSNEKNQWQ